MQQPNGNGGAPKSKNKLLWLILGFGGVPACLLLSALIAFLYVGTQGRVVPEAQGPNGTTLRPSPTSMVSIGLGDAPDSPSTVDNSSVSIGGAAPTAAPVTLAATPTPQPVGADLTVDGYTIAVEQVVETTWRDLYTNAEQPVLVAIVQLRNDRDSSVRWPADAPQARLVGADGPINAGTLPLWGQMNGRIANLDAVAAPTCTMTPGRLQAMLAQSLNTASQPQTLLPGDAIRTLLAFPKPATPATALEFSIPDRPPLQVSLDGAATPNLAPQIADLPAPNTIAMEATAREITELPVGGIDCLPVQKITLRVTNSANTLAGLSLPVVIAADGARWTAMATGALLAKPGESDIVIYVPNIGEADKLVFRFGSDPANPESQLVLELP